jgi:hypothetical protein
MWTCNICGRIFEKVNQSHTCHKVPIEDHFKNKDIAKDIFSYLFRVVNEKVGTCQIVSLPCCIHLFGEYDYLAALPKKDRLEIRFTLNRKINCPQLIQSIPISQKSYKHCLNIKTTEEINGELIKMLNESYHLKSGK